MLRHLSISILALMLSTSCASLSAQPAGVKTVEFEAPSIGRTTKYNVVLPRGYEQSNDRYPVLYLLHGLYADYRQWGDLGVPEYARLYDMIVVMPDAGNAWYANWAESEGKNAWEDFIVRDLIGHVDAHYRTLARREGRAIGGLSMGGYGAMTLGLRHPDLFGSIGSHSGAFDFARRCRENLEAGKLPYAPEEAPSAEPDEGIGIEGFSSQDERFIEGRIFADHEQIDAHDPFKLILEVPREKLPHIYFDCGTEDFLLEPNREFLRLCVDNDIPVVFGQSDGGHEHAYWKREVAVSMGVQYAAMRRMLAASGGIR